MTVLVFFVMAVVMVVTPIAVVMNIIMMFMIMLMLSCRDYANILKVNWCTKIQYSLQTKF